MMLEKQEIEYAKLDGKKLAYLCLKDRITDYELLSCLFGIPREELSGLQQGTTFKGK